MIKVSIPMCAYNQAAYIGDAIGSVLAQKGNFEIELIVGDDKSTDGTTEIVKKYASENKNIKAQFRAINIGAARNFQELYNSCSGDYIALLDGDDMWITENKLQRQIDLMEQFHDCAVCFHNCAVRDKDGRLSLFHPKLQMPTWLPSKTLLWGNIMQTCTVMYRHKNVPTLPDWLNDLPMGDWPMHLLHLEHGHMGYIDEVMGLYNINPSSSWVSLPEVERWRRTIKTAEALIAGHFSKYKDELQAGIRRDESIIFQIEKNNVSV